MIDDLMDAILPYFIVLMTIAMCAFLFVGLPLLIVQNVRAHHAFFVECEATNPHYVCVALWRH